MMSRLQVERNDYIWIFQSRQNLILAQNFANDAVKAGEDLVDQIPKQGQKLGEQAFEMGKDKGNIHISLFFLIHLENNLIGVFLLLQQTKHSKLLNKPVSPLLFFESSKIRLFSGRC